MSFVAIVEITELPDDTTGVDPEFQARRGLEVIEQVRSENPQLANAPWGSLLLGQIGWYFELDSKSEVCLEPKLGPILAELPDCILSVQSIKSQFIKERLQSASHHVKWYMM